MSVHPLPLPTDQPAPLTTLEYVGLSDQARTYYTVVCRDCGDVTRQESGGTVNDAPLPQATLYQQRHLARHLAALSAEITEAAR